MSGPSIGELFSGYGGLGIGVQAVYGGAIAWHSDIDKGARKILTHRYPGVPNLGDITTVDWSSIKPVDILTGGSPCQDLSHAGRRAGMTDGTRSNLWVAMREAIAQLRPRMIVWENVRGAYSACADSDLGRCPRCVDPSSPGGHDPRLRALGRVLGDLSDLGYDASWHGLRAADVGAPHGRFRVFVVAQDADQSTRGERRLTAPGQAQGGRAWPDIGGRGGDLLPTPVSGDADRASLRYDRGNPTLIGALLPTPAVNDMGEGKTVERWDEWTADMQARHGNGNGHGKSLSIEAQRLDSLLPTPRAFGSRTSRHAATTAYRRSAPSLEQAVEIADGVIPREIEGQGDVQPSWSREWGDYAAAIARWEYALGRPAPAPTQTSSKGNPQLAPAFVEWMMGLPAGWVTDVPGITRNEALKALGNGVVPQQAAEGLRVMASWEVAAA